MPVARREAFSTASLGSAGTQTQDPFETMVSNSKHIVTSVV
jgi:hypothetical protein